MGTAGEFPDMWEVLTMDVVLTVEGRMDLSSLRDGFMVRVRLLDNWLQLGYRSALFCYIYTLNTPLHPSPSLHCCNMGFWHVFITSRKS